VAQDKLAKYRSKRDFRQTAEPRGSRAIGNPGRLRFVIQKHAARRLHYDLRLELDGVFKSWAVTRGPSLNPADKRLAVEVEDHPLDYGDFEGTIAQGQYGGGTVQLWDRGYWQPLPGISAADALQAGELKFELFGQRLHGSWVLVRMRHDRERSKRTNWLLIKHRDAAADPAHAEALLAEDRSIASGRSMDQIAAGRGKGPKPFMRTAGGAAPPDAMWASKRAASPQPVPPPVPVSVPVPVSKTRRRRAAQAMPKFIEPQLATLVDRPPGSSDWVHEVKFDGYRIQLRVESGAAVLRTRKGLDWSDKFPEIAREAAALPDCIIDGEVVALDARRVPDFAALQAALSDRQTAKLTYFVFDLLFLEGEDLRPLPLSERKQRLARLLADRRAGNIRYVEHFQAGADAVLASACRMSLEGIVSKRSDAPYASGRVGSWTKSKCRAGHEVVIGGYTFRAGAPRSLLVGVHRGPKLVYVGRVGTGFGQQAAAALLPRLKAVAATRSPFSGPEAPRSEPGVRWVQPTLVAEIEFAGWTGSGMVRQAAFKGLREDKPAGEVKAEKPSKLVQTDIKPLLAAKRTAAPRRRTDRAATPGRARAATRSARVAVTADGPDQVLGVTISQPDKSLWPDAGDARPVSKLELAQYYAAVGDWMIAHLEGRPCSLVRAPDGIGRGTFFQRHAMPGTSALLELVTVRGDRKPYLQIDRVPGLVAAAQIAALELHPWNCIAYKPEVPGRLVFDLDPAPDVAFGAVIKAALELRERLQALGLRAFCKSTGGKGLHVVTPLANERTPLDWAAAKTFAQALCVQMAADSPTRYLTTMAKKDRGGRIFLDYLRNDRMATAVAPLSPRAREGATVSMPLLWPQVKSGLDPKRFTVRSAPGLLARDKPWQDYAESAQPLRAAVTRFTAPGTISARTGTRGVAARKRAR
jgi:bifunctional non-homologous end joining protein LigD